MPNVILISTPKITQQPIKTSFHLLQYVSPVQLLESNILIHITMIILSLLYNTSESLWYWHPRIIPYRVCIAATLFLAHSRAFSGAFKTLWSTYEVCSTSSPVKCMKCLENAVRFSVWATQPTTNELRQKRHNSGNRLASFPDHLQITEDLKTSVSSNNICCY